MPVEHKPRKSKSLTHASSHKKHSRVAKPLVATIPSVIPELPLPMPDEPAKVAPPPPILVKTTYNRRRFWQAGSVLAVCVIIALAYLAYTQRGYWLAIIQPTATTSPVYHLKVTPEKIDSSKAQTALQQSGQTQASNSASLSPIPTTDQGSSNTLKVPSAEILATYNSEQLQSLLEQQMSQLQSEKQDIRTLQSYLTRAHNQPAQAVSILKEGVQLAKEFQALYLYYK